MLLSTGDQAYDFADNCEEQNCLTATKQFLANFHVKSIHQQNRQALLQSFFRPASMPPTLKER